MSWLRKSNLACGCRQAPTPWSHWRSARRRHGFATARPGRRGWWPNPASRPCSTNSSIVSRHRSSRRDRAAPHSAWKRTSPRGFWIPCAGPSSTSRPAMCIKPICRGVGRAGRPLRSIPSAFTSACAPPIPVRSRPLLRYGDFACLSSSPERLVSIRGSTVSTRPIAGTRPRGATPEADAALVRSLLDNEKERAEHVMLIDLERNDLGRVCAGGSVRVDEYMSVETYAHVHHIVSNVSGRLRNDVSAHRRDPRAVSRRHDHGVSQSSLHGNHFGARRSGPRRLHRFHRLLEPRRQL